jgi:hypothetical protein
MRERRRDNESAIGLFLSFPADAMLWSPKQLKPLSPTLAARIDALAGHLPFNPHEDLGDESLI